MYVVEEMQPDKEKSLDLLRVVLTGQTEVAWIGEHLIFGNTN